MVPGTPNCKTHSNYISFPHFLDTPKWAHDHCLKGFPIKPQRLSFFLTGDRPVFRDVKDRQGAARKPDITKNEVG